MRRRLALLCGAALLSGTAPGAGLVLTAEQSTGGKILTFGKDQAIKGVTLDKDCLTNFATPADACIEWKLAAPLSTGWWHGVVEPALPKDRYGGQRGINVMLVSTRRPSVNIEANFRTNEQFEFWIYMHGVISSCASVIPSLSRDLRLAWQMMTEILRLRYALLRMTRWSVRNYLCRYV